LDQEFFECCARWTTVAMVSISGGHIIWTV
jgi:hypothetical protein